MKEVASFLKYKILSNSVENWLWFFGIIFVGWLIKKLLSNLISQIVFRLIKKKSDKVALADFLKLLRPPFEFIIRIGSFYLAVDELIIPTKWKIIPLGKIPVGTLIDRTLDTLFIIAITWILIQLVKFVAILLGERFLETESKVDEHLVPFFRDIIIAVIVFIAFFTELGFVFKQDVVSLITGLGIGGVAIALASRETLENLFASFTIFSDRPFIAGDEVQIGTDAGKVEKVGFRSTRVRSYDGSMIVIPNRVIISQAINNTTQRKERRHKFYLRVELETPIVKVQAVVKEIDQLLDARTDLNKKETHVKFDSVGEYSVNILIVFFVQTSDFWESLTAREEINYSIAQILNENHIKIAIPPAIVPTK